MASAFELRQGEEYLSVNWLEYFNSPDRATAVDAVRKVFSEKGFRLRQNGRFAVFNVGEATIAVREGVGRSLIIEHLPLDDDGSHAGVFGYTEDDFAVAVELKALVSYQDIHPALG